MTTIQELAAQMNEALIQDTRNDGTEFVHLRTGSPEWMTDVIREAHGDAFPDDTIYRFIEKAVDAIENNDDAEDAIREIEPDIYTHDLTKWLHERLDHVYYLTQALEEFGSTDGFQLLGMAQSLHIQEVADGVLRGLNAVLADMEDEELEDEGE